MSRTALIELTGVLRADNGSPIVEGTMLYNALAAWQRLVVVVEDAEADERWLTINGFREHAQLLVGEMPLAVRQARGKLGMDVQLVVTPSPATAAASMHAGVTTLLFAHPRFARPEFRADYDGDKREWAEIVAEIDAQRDTRVRVPQRDDD